MISEALQRIFSHAVNYARANRHEYITVEHIFVYLLKEKSIISLLNEMQMDIDFVYSKLKTYILKNTPQYPKS